MTPTVVLFDIDGTLVTCGGAGRLAMQAVLCEIVGSADALDFPFAGGTDRSIARRALDGAGEAATDDAIDAFLERYLQHLPAMLTGNEKYRVHVGVFAILERLEAREGYAIGLGTGNVETGAREKLRHGDLSERFAFGGFGCDHEERPRLIAAGADRGAARLGQSRDACRVVVIGDTPNDVAAALAIGAECIGVGTGPFDAQRLMDAGATMAVDDLTDGRATRSLLEPS